MIEWLLWEFLLHLLRRSGFGSCDGFGFIFVFPLFVFLSSLPVAHGLSVALEGFGRVIPYRPYYL